ncbi:MAG: VOC family protein [Betaproteobacteria bacterium]|nr:MAG: VOC family protein [Betaproteobacteria bacterium]
MNTSSTIDHLIVTAPNLKAGVQWVRDALGATPEFGGKHKNIGTHNCLLSLGEDTYLEVISPDPNAPDPGRPRLFDLDNVSEPRLATWVARTSDIHSAVSACTETLGVIEPMSRGELNWLITFTSDGSLLLGGIAPALIEWQGTFHPSQKLRDEGCKLLAVELHHSEPARVERLLQSIDLDTGRIRVVESGSTTSPHIVAEIETRQGVKTLS